MNFVTTDIPDQSVPEPSIVFGLLALTVLGTSQSIKQQQVKN